MDYPNAQKGIKKIFNYEVIQIVIGLLAIMITVLSIMVFDGNKVLAGNKVAVGTGLVIIAAGLAIVILAIISIPILLKGLKLASKDEPDNFKTAFYASLIVFIGSILNGLSSSVEVIGNYSKYINAAVSGTTLLMFMCIIFGIRSIADQIGRPDIVKLSLPIIVITIAISFVSIIGRFLEDSTMEVFSTILSLVSYVIYLIYLSKAKKMFD